MSSEQTISILSVLGSFMNERPDLRSFKSAANARRGESADPSLEELQKTGLTFGGSVQLWIAPKDQTTIASPEAVAEWFEKLTTVLDALTEHGYNIHVERHYPSPELVALRTVSISFPVGRKVTTVSTCVEISTSHPDLADVCAPEDTVEQKEVEVRNHIVINVLSHGLSLYGFKSLRPRGRGSLALVAELEAFIQEHRDSILSES